MPSLRLIATLTTAFSTLTASLPTQLVQDCLNAPDARTCWTLGYNAAVNADITFPDTGKIVEYNLVASSQTMSPDGVAREMMVFNGQYPGPPIVANWGDTIRVTVTNNLPNNGTGIHWHGVRQLHTNQMDGTSGITECPIAPGQTKVYTFKATQYGTSWYHSHYSVQYSNGLVGPIVINGPTSANYDIDLGALPITDWYDTPAFTILASAPRTPPVSQSILVNGTGPSQPPVITFTPNKKHLIRFINTGINAHFHVGIDGHSMTVVAADFVPVRPFSVTSLPIAIGQRYDVIVEADQDVSSYYLRVTNGGGVCDGRNEQAQAGNTKGAIIRYAGAENAEPTSTALELPSGCTEQSGLVPIIPIPVPQSSNPTSLRITVDDSGAPIWMINGVAIRVDWTKPTLSYLLDGIQSLPSQENALTITNAGWVYLLVENDTPLPHPIHLHGHDFWVLSESLGNSTDTSAVASTDTGASAGTEPAASSWVSTATSSTVWWTPSPSATTDWAAASSAAASSWVPTTTSSTVWWTPSPSATAEAASPSAGLDARADTAAPVRRQFSTPIRRDTYTVQSGGSILLAYQADNPGAWLLHCHIPWHISGGMGVQFLERPSEISSRTLGDLSGLTGGCATWDANPIPQTDSGLRIR